MRVIKTPVKPVAPKVEFVLTKKEATFLFCLVSGTNAGQIKLAFKGTALESMDTDAIYAQNMELYHSFRKELRGLRRTK